MEASVAAVGSDCRVVQAGREEVQVGQGVAALGGLEDDCECWANSGWRSLVNRVYIECEYCRLMLECSWIYVRQKEGGYAGSQPIRSALEITTLEERRRRRQGIETDGCC